MSARTIQEAVILAAGRGTRLAPLTDDRPKSLLPILGQPILARVIESLWQGGVSRCVVVTGPHAGRVQAATTSFLPAHMAIEWVVQPSPSGTVDALQMALPLLSGPFLLTAVDNLTPVDHVRALIACHQAAADHVATLSLVSATPAEIRQSADVLLQDNRVVSIAEKPSHPRGRHAAMMFYAFSLSIAGYLSAVQPSGRGEREIVSALQLALAAGQKINAITTPWRLHLTHPHDLLHLNSWYLKQEDVSWVFSALPSSTRLIPPVRVDPGVHIGENVTLGPCVYLESGATVGDHARLHHAVVLTGGTVPPFATLCNVVIDRHRCFVAGEPEQLPSTLKE